MPSPYREEHDHFRNTVRQFATKELAPYVEEWEKAELFPDHVFKRAGELGILGAHYPEEHGGAGGDYWFSVAKAEELPRCLSAGVSMGLLVQSDMATPVISDLGTKEQIAEFLTPAIKGEKIAALGVSEPNAGSDVAGIQTWAKKDGDDWIINGAKAAWVSNGTVATHAMVHFAVDRSAGPVSTAIGLVPLNLPGVSKGKPLNKIGQRALNQGEIYFDNVRIPNSYVFVPPELYPFAGDMILATANGGMGATFTGLARAAFEEAMAYCKQRVQGGKLLCEHQLIQRKLFDMFIKVESARQLSRAVLTYNSVTEPPLARYGVASKVYCTQVAFEVASDAVQLFGGLGLCKECLVEKLFRDARAALIEDGANDTLALVATPSLVESFI